MNTFRRQKLTSTVTALTTLLFFLLITIALNAQEDPPPGSTESESSTLIDPCDAAFSRVIKEDFSQTVLEALVNDTLAYREETGNEADSESNVTLASVHDGAGPYHFDQRSINVRLPDGISAADILSEMQRNLNQTVASPTFDSYVMQQPRRRIGAAQVGDIYDVDLFFSEALGLPVTLDSPEDGSVILTDIGETYYVMTTITNPRDFYSGHPTPGTREWGATENADGSVTFYTVGLSRAGSISGFETIDDFVMTDAIIKIIHDIQGDAWRAMLVGLAQTIQSLGGEQLGTPAGATLELEEMPECASNQLDLVFVIDTTSSMADDIAAVRRDALSIIDRVAAGGADWRIALVTYRDHPRSPYGEPGDYPSRVDLDFTSSPDEIIDAINLIRVDGGADTPESVFSGLVTAIELSWRLDARKTIILMGDAPPHDPEPVTEYTMSSVLRAAFLTDPHSIYPILIESNQVTREAFQTLADGSSGRLYNAASADEVVETLYSTIDAIKRESLLSGTLKEGDTAVISIPAERFGLRLGPGRSFSLAEKLDAPTPVVVTGKPQFNGIDIWWPVRSLVSDYEGWTVEAREGTILLIPTSEDELPDRPVIPDCTITAPNAVNKRVYPSTRAAVTSQFVVAEPQKAVGQIIGADGFEWWYLDDESWVRSDIVESERSCRRLPEARPWLDETPAAAGFTPPGNRIEPPAGSRVARGGRGLSNGGPVNNGDFQIEGYCSGLGYRTITNDVDWQCATDRGDKAFTLGAKDFDVICRRTYDDPWAIAILDGEGKDWAYRWRCHTMR